MSNNRSSYQQVSNTDESKSTEFQVKNQTTDRLVEQQHDLSVRKKSLSEKINQRWLQITYQTGKLFARVGLVVASMGTFAYNAFTAYSNNYKHTAANTDEILRIQSAEAAAVLSGLYSSLPLIAAYTGVWAASEIFDFFLEKYINHVQHEISQIESQMLIIAAEIAARGDGPLTEAQIAAAVEIFNDLLTQQYPDTPLDAPHMVELRNQFIERLRGIAREASMMRMRGVQSSDKYMHGALSSENKGDNEELYRAPLIPSSIGEDIEAQGKSVPSASSNLNNNINFSSSSSRPAAPSFHATDKSLVVPNLRGIWDAKNRGGRSDTLMRKEAVAVGSIEKISSFNLHDNHPLTPIFQNVYRCYYPNDESYKERHLQLLNKSIATAIPTLKNPPTTTEGVTEAHCEAALKLLFLTNIALNNFKLADVEKAFLTGKMHADYHPEAINSAVGLNQDATALAIKDDAMSNILIQQIRSNEVANQQQAQPEQSAGMKRAK